MENRLHDKIAELFKHFRNNNDLKGYKLAVEVFSLFRDADTITLSRKDAEVFFNALSELKEANEALKSAAKLYQK